MKKEPMNLNKIKTSRTEKILNAISSRPTSEVKKGVNLVDLARNLAKRHVEKTKSSEGEEV